MSEGREPVDLLAFVGEAGRRYVLPTEPEPAPVPRSLPTPAPSRHERRQRRADAKAQSRAAHRAASRAEHLARAGIVVETPAAPADGEAADLAELAGDPDQRYVTAVADGSHRQRAWLVCVLLLALGLPALVVTYGYNRGAEPAEALAAPPTTVASSIEDTTSESLVRTESTVEETTTTVEETTTAPTEAPTTSATYATTSTTAYATTSTVAYAANAVQIQAAPSTTAAPTTTTTAYVAPTTAPPAQGEAAFLACVRMRESGGNYGAVSPDGLYRGAYQFHQSTWNNVASMAGRGDLAGVLPNLASPADQDLLAVTLYRAAGPAPWGGACH